MLSIVKSMALQGLEGYIIDVEVDVSAGLPSWEIVGLPDVSVRESKERVKASIRNSGYELYSRKIVVNLAPADIKKEGPFFDLPIAIGVLLSLGEIKQQNFTQIAFIGELSLDGKLNSVNGILPMCIEAKKLGIKKVIIPRENLLEVSILKDIQILGASSLIEVIDYLNGKIKLPQKLKEEKQNNKNANIDFSEVKGQENVKRALEIAAAGGHNVLLIRESSAHGKTMLARRIPTILPDLTFEESLEVTKIHSIAGILPKDIPIISERPFRSPHHTISSSSLVGGGKYPRPRRN